MTKAWSYISLFGDAFSPAVAEEKTGLSFHEKHGVGEYGTQGRFKNQPYPFGHASLEPPKGVSEAEQFAWLLDSILPHIETLRQLGVTGGRLHVTYAYDSQCNLEYKPELLVKLARLGLPFTVSCYQDEDEFEE